MIKKCMLASLLLLTHCARATADEPTNTQPIPEKRIVLIVCSYNNKEWYKANLDSIAAQKYDNYHVIYTNDASSDGTGELVRAYLKEKGMESRFTLIDNKERHGAMENQYNAINLCDDTDIIGILDGDDCLAHDGVLAYLNRIYADPNVWLTYGQFIEWPSNARGFCAPYPQEIIVNNDFRHYVHTPSHMRTFYAGLFKQIKKEDLFYQGNFMPMSCDMAAMIPMIEMACDHHRFIPDILYIYNGANVINDHKVSKELQKAVDIHIRSKEKYQKTESPFRTPLTKNVSTPDKPSYNIGLLIVATGKYIQFVEPLINSARTHFCPGHNITYFVFTDGQLEHPALDIVTFYHKRLGWPFDTMMRFAMYDEHAQDLARMDYLFACDADMRFVDTVGDEILGDLVGTQHPGFVGRRGTYETNPTSLACIKAHEGEIYFAGGFYGGKSDNVLTLVHTLISNIHTDLANNIIAIWHDESHLNRYFIDHKPTVILSPSYCYPESWNLPYKKRLLALDKKHSDMRA